MEFGTWYQINCGSEREWHDDFALIRDSGFDFSAERIRRSVEESLVRLKTDWIDVFQVHDIEYGQREQIVGETLPEMFRLKDAGKVRFVGITGYPLGILRDVAEAVEVDTILSGL